MNSVLRVLGGIVCLGLGFLVYLGLGVLISYARQPKVSQAWKDAFRPGDLYGDGVCCERARVIEGNVDALHLRLKMIESARHRIILSTFEFRADESGKDVLCALQAAAKRGVRIQIVTDGFPTLQQMDRSAYFHALAAMDGVEMRVYNRLNLLLPWKLMGRLHDKYLIVDDSVYLLGGRNTYDFFLGDNGYKNFDRDVLVYTSDPADPGCSIRQVEAYFKSIWEHRACRRFPAWKEGRIAAARAELEERYRSLPERYPDIAQPMDYPALTFETGRITLLSNPIHVYAKEPTLFYALTELMKHERGDIFIHTPYIICNQWMYDCLRDVCQCHAHTTLLTNSVANNGNPFGAGDYALNKGKLVDTGLEILEYEGGVSYHGKSLTLGDRLAVVGSFNMDMRSVYLDTELMLAVDSRAVTEQLRRYMAAYEAHCVRVVDREHDEVPEGVQRQELSSLRSRRLKLLRPFSWLRFLM